MISVGCPAHLSRRVPDTWVTQQIFWGNLRCSGMSIRMSLSGGYTHGSLGGDTPTESAIRILDVWATLNDFSPTRTPSGSRSRVATNSPGTGTVTVALSVAVCKAALKLISRPGEPVALTRHKDHGRHRPVSVFCLVHGRTRQFGSHLFMQPHLHLDHRSHIIGADFEAT